MRFVFVMDPLDRVTHDKDTTFAFLQAAQARGHQSYHCLLRDLFISNGETWATVHRVEILEAAPWIILHKEQGPERIRLAETDAVFMRKDPPFDRAYLYGTLMLERCRGGPLLINDPRGLRDANEKLYALNFPEWTPRTLVTADRSMIHDFCRDVGGTAMIKPLDGAGGSGVIQIKTGDKTARAIVDMLTHEGHRLALVQEFLPSVSEGDKRVLLIDGVALPFALARIPQGSEVRGNLAAGGKGVARPISARDREIAETLGPVLAARGLLLVGLDVIGDCLTEINVTSPTCFQEIFDQTGCNVAALFIDALEAALRG